MKGRPTGRHSFLWMFVCGNLLQAGLSPAQNMLDVVYANSGQQSEICLNQGSFVCTVIDNEVPERNVSAGDLDLVFGNGDQPNRVCLGDGTGVHQSWTCSEISSDMARTTDVDVGDLDADGNLDVVFVNGLSQTNRVCFGDGSGNAFRIALDRVFSDGFETGSTSGW